MRIINSLIIILFFSLPTFAQNDFTKVLDDEVLRESIRKHSSETFTIKSKFSQEKHLSMLEEVVISSGRFLFKKENNIRWEYSLPFEYTIIVANGKFLINNEGKLSEFDISSNPMFKQISDMIVLAVSGNFVQNDQFNIEFFQNGKYYLATLKPVDQQVSEMLSGINIYFDKNALNVEKVKFLEPGNDFTLINFTDYQENINLSDEEFTTNK